MSCTVASEPNPVLLKFRVAKIAISLYNTSCHNFISYLLTTLPVPTSSVSVEQSLTFTKKLLAIAGSNTLFVTIFGALN